MKKRILAMLLSVVMLASTVELTSLLTGTNILAGTEAPAVTDTAPTSDTDTASGGQRITDEDTAAVRLSGSELSVSGDIEPGAAQPSSGGTATLDENNALTIPYDLAFPEEFASDDCLYAGDQIMVKFARGFRGKLNTTLVRAGITGLEKLMDTSTGVWYIASVTGDVQQVMANVRALDNVVLAEYDYMYAAADTTLIDSDTVAEGKIIRQEPAAGELLEEGGTISLVVSKGPEMIEMPNVIGFTQEGAVKELESRGLVPSCFMVVNDGSYASGCVVSCSAEAGTSVEAGSVIVVYIAADPSVENVPATPEQPAASDNTDTADGSGEAPADSVEYDTD